MGEAAVNILADAARLIAPGNEPIEQPVSAGIAGIIARAIVEPYPIIAARLGVLHRGLGGKIGAIDVGDFSQQPPVIDPEPAAVEEIGGAAAGSSFPDLFAEIEVLFDPVRVAGRFIGEHENDFRPFHFFGMFPDGPGHFAERLIVFVIVFLVFQHPVGDIRRPFIGPGIIAERTGEPGSPDIVEEVVHGEIAGRTGTVEINDQLAVRAVGHIRIGMFITAGVHSVFDHVGHIADLEAGIGGTTPAARP